LYLRILENKGAITSHCSSVKSVSYFCLIIHSLYHFLDVNTRSNDTDTLEIGGGYGTYATQQSGSDVISMSETDQYF